MSESFRFTEAEIDIVRAFKEDTITQDYLSSLVDKTVIFNNKIKEYEGYAERGMKGIVTKFKFSDPHGDDPVHRVWIDLSLFEEQNHKLQNSNFYNSEGKPILTAVEAGWYHPIDNYYISSNILDLPFDLEEDIHSLVVDRITLAVMRFITPSLKHAISTNTLKKAIEGALKDE